MLERVVARLRATDEDEEDITLAELKKRPCGKDVYPQLYRSCLHDDITVSTRILGRRTEPFHLSLFLTASRMVLPQDPSTDPNCALLGRW